MNLKSLYEEYLKQYIKHITKNQNVFHISICDIEFEIIELIKDFKYEDIKIATISKLNYSQAVEYRNDLSIDKIVIISPFSVKRIDSLKDFNEYTILPKVAEKDDWFWEIIESIFELKKDETKGFRKYITIVIQEQIISLTQLLEYIYNCILNGSINKELLNQNLYLVNCWKSNQKEILKPVDLKKLIHLSEPTEIEKRISNIVTNDIEVKNVGQFNKIKALVFNNDFENLFTRYFYEDMPEQFRKRPPRIIKEKPITENEELINQYIFSYDAFIEDVQELGIEEFEEKLLSDECDIKLSEIAINSFRNFMDDYKLEDDIEKIEKIIDEVKDKININPIGKKELVDSLTCLKQVTQRTLLNIKDKNIYPIYLFSFCKNTRNLFEEYFKLLSLVIKNESVYKALSGNAIVESIQNLFTTIDNSYINMAFFHPVAIFYYTCLKEKYEEVSSDIKSCDNEELKTILKDMVGKNENKFPISFLLNKGEKYVLNSSLHNVDAYFKFNKKNSLSNSTIVDTRIITSKIKEYILRFPYKPEISVSIVGNISFGNIETLYRTVQKILEKTEEVESVLRILRINIITEDDRQLKDSLDQLKGNGYFNDIIQYSFSKYKYMLNGVLSLEKISNDVDMLFLLDCDLLYKKDELESVENANYITYDIVELKYNDWLEKFNTGKNNTVGVVWDTLQNIMLNGKKNLSAWNRSALDNNIINSLKQKIDDKKELMVILLTSNLKAAEEIYIEQYLASTIKNYAGELLMLTFSSNIENEDFVENENISKCSFSIKNLLDNILDNSQIKEFVDYVQGEYEVNIDYLEKLVIEFVYKHSGSNLIVNCFEYENSDCNDELTEQNSSFIRYEGFISSIMLYAFDGSSSMSRLLKSIIIDLLYSSIENYSDALLVNYIENYYRFSKNDIRFLNMKNRSGQAKVEKNNWIRLRNIITYVEKYYIPDPKFRTVYKNKYDPSYLEQLLYQAKSMPINDNSLIEKMQYILKGD